MQDYTSVGMEDSSSTTYASSSRDFKAVSQIEDKKVIESSVATLRWKFWIGLSMHIFLVLVHITLIAVLYAGHLENRISLPLGRPANIASVVIVVVTQVVNQVCSRHLLLSGCV